MMAARPASTGSMPSASWVRALSRRSRAFAIETSGQMPMESVRCLSR
jgi:hypothetical protein